MEWASFADALIYNVPHNTAVVLRGTTLLGLASGIVGSFLLLRKRSLVADAVSHAALPGVAIGFLLAAWLNSGSRFGVEPRSLAVLMPAAALFGLLGVWCVQLLSGIPRIKEDAAIGVVLSVFFAVGIVLLGLIQRMPMHDKSGLNQFIFGQAATMRSSDATIIGLIALIVTAVCVAAFKELKSLCFDRSFTRSIGWSSLTLDAVLLAMVTALTVVGLGAVGALLMVALLIIPSAAARFWTHRLPVMVLLAAGIGAVACHVGTAASATFEDLPTGPAIVVACGSLFIFSMLLAPQRGLVASIWQRMTLARTVGRQHLLRAMFELQEMTEAPITIDQLKRRRSWTDQELQRLLRRVKRRGELEESDGAYALSERGHEAASRVVRTHRIWEHFLTTQADIAPSHVDRAADDIEHALSEELIHELEHELRASGALPAGEFVPRSAHRLGIRRDE